MAKRKRIGRPPKPPKNRKSVNFTFRSREEMREQLRVAADRSGRSISEEIEYRLNQSFQKGTDLGGRREGGGAGRPAGTGNL